MGEKRKPAFVLLLRIPGKTGGKKLELFPAELWSHDLDLYRLFIPGRYRLRVQGKWWPREDRESGIIKTYTLTQVCHLLRKSMCELRPTPGRKRRQRAT